VASVLRSDGIAPERIAVVHSGVDVEAAEAARPGGWRARLGIPADAPLAVSVGALVPHKDHGTLLDAAALLRDRCASLRWAIAGEGELRAELEHRRERLGIAERMHFLGQLDDPLPLLAESDLFVMSSREEGLGTSVLDAMARGIPVASTEAGGLPEMLAGGAGLLVSARDPSALADAVFRIVTQPDLRAEIGARARVAVQRFTAARMAEEVLTVYRSCGTYT
jgi:glycosyltransferase involved in cell wall biosynthesis